MSRSRSRRGARKKEGERCIYYRMIGGAVTTFSTE
jgi:hypothetical protein